ncbi:putative mRNA-splicing protein ubp10 [Cyberlindnera fabianii]|uniref:Putative mRNA-splicing protein ubp10 n=1 Tax=Cyberlindnera fabianii TaxID=36022 RepID=A0A1V2LAH7_CYBFA|nr:putative mRNA-splicing protein ubp10 [Cyberlindnera fabianii]
MTKRPISSSEIPTDSPKRQRLTTSASPPASPSPPAIQSPSSQQTHQQALENLYLDTIDRKRLDFDFEKLCSVTLSNVNIYGCLTCGKYFQGRGKSSPAYFHSVNEDHHVFINFNTLKVYLLPENKIVENSLLDDIKYAINPTYNKDDLKKLTTIQARDLSGVTYSPGFVGLNDIKMNDYANVVLQLVSHIKSVRDFCLLSSDNDKHIPKNELNKAFTIFVKKLWSPRLFKNHISPHELLQLIGVISNKKFTISEQKPPRDFLLWLLNTLHKSFTDPTTKTSVFSTIQGKLQVTSTSTSTVTTTKFWILTLDLPASSLFKSKSGVHEIPQISLQTLLSKYDGITETHTGTTVQTYKILKYPSFLILDIPRFRDKSLNIPLSVKDRNQTIVQFPLEIEFDEGKVKYRLVSNIVHELKQSDELNKDDDSSWKVQLRKSQDEWVEIKDLKVEKKEEAYLFLGETCLQLWERIK